MTTSNVTLTTHLLAKRGNTSVSSTYTGLVGELVVDTDLNTVRVQDGVTAGGHLLANLAQIDSNVNISSTNANVAAANLEIISLQANTTASNVEIDALRANITAANASIALFAANAGFATQTAFNTLCQRWCCYYKHCNINF